MSKLVVSSEIAKSLTEKNKLNYFKRELIKILEKSDEIVEKAGYGIGVVRVWKGEKYRKIAPGKWRKIYESNTRGARQSINIIRKKIQNAASTDELLQIVMENTNRFMDAEGKLLPIVEELKRAVNESKGKLNAGKPSTQEQIDKFKKENGKSEEDQYSEDIKEIDAAYNKITHIDIDKNDYEGMKAIIDKAKDIYGKITKNLREAEDEGDWGKIGTYEKLKNELHPLLSRIQWRYNEVEQNHKKDKVVEGIENIDTENLTEAQKMEVQKFDNEIKNFIENKNGSFWRLEQDLIDLCNNSKATVEGGKIWLKQHNCTKFDDFVKYVKDELNKWYAEKQRQKKEEEKKAREEKINKINQNNGLKTYTDEEINKALEGINSLISEKESLKEQLKEVLKKEDDARNRYHTALLNHDETRQKIWEEVLEYRKQANKLADERDSFEKKLDEFMDPVAYYYLNNYKYKKDESIDNCKTIEEVENLIKSKDWYSEEGKQRLNLNKMDIRAAKEVFKRMERIFAIFPEQKGRPGSLYCEPARGRVWAFASGGGGITFNSTYYKNYSEVRSDYDRTEGTFHPKGTNADDIVYHEYYHVMTAGSKNRFTIAKRIKANVTKNLKMKGKKGGPKQDDIIKYGVSEYATVDADEFGAECFCQALGSKNPSAFAIEVFKETLKYKKYMRGIV